MVENCQVNYYSIVDLEHMLNEERIRSKSWVGKGGVGLLNYFFGKKLILKE